MSSGTGLAQGHQIHMVKGGLYSAAFVVKTYLRQNRAQ